MEEQIKLAEELYQACKNVDYEQVKKIMKNPLSKTIINLPYVTIS